MGNGKRKTENGERRTENGKRFVVFFRFIGKGRQTEGFQACVDRPLGLAFFSFPTIKGCRVGERRGRGGWGRTFKTPLASADASTAMSLSVAGDTGGCAYALGMELEGGGGANDMIDARLGPCDERSRPAELMTTSGRVSRSRSSTCAPERTTPPVDRSRASRSTRRGTRPRWRRARRSAAALGQTHHACVYLDTVFRADAPKTHWR